ncbi:hypothetical protein A374_11415 [Fictibacillus macauensis ZFHKF-1]|uniref:ATP-grasp domain-containing protein n=2 Tax=Fictibacillus TaxID=1329200 RepID=I8AIP8_9BACL|nr:hypothetical protein A374_11415 [Fictibacillus macauensis ZFHKF-1]
MTISGWLIYQKQASVTNASYIKWMQDEAAAVGLSLTLMYVEDFAYGVTNHRLSLYYNEEHIALPTFAIMRGVDPFLSAHLEKMGITVFNNSALASIANDKARTYQFLAGLHIPMMDSIFLVPSRFSLASLPFSFPLVAKLASGRGGTDVHLVHHPNELEAIFREHFHERWVLQKCLLPYGKDVRVFIVNNEIIGAVLRSSSTQFHANVSLGGEASFYELSTEQRQLVQRILDVVTIDMAGIDFLVTENGEFIFNEIEDAVGSRSLSATSSINIVQCYMTHIAQHLHNSSL